jgi:hypothetical protein
VSLLVLDTSAIKAFAAGSIDVGEPIAEVHSDGGRVVVPVVCLIEAARQVGDDMPHVLVDNPACEVAALIEELWAAVTAGVRILGRLDLAVALLTATMGDGYVLTAEPESYGEIGEDSVIPIDDK